MPGDALKALSKLHQTQYAVPPPEMDEPWDDYMSEAQQESDDMSMEDDSDDMMQPGMMESPALDALRRLQAVNAAAHGME